MHGYFSQALQFQTLDTIFFRSVQRGPRNGSVKAHF